MSEQGSSVNEMCGGNSDDALSAPSGSLPPGTSSSSPALTEREVLSDAWAQWLAGVPWDVFGTITFRIPLRRQSALRRWLGLCRMFAVDAGFAVAEDAGEKSTRVNPGLQDVHVHFLVRFGSDIRNRRPFMQEICRRMWEFSFNKWGFARFEPFKSGGNAPKYCVKYILKGESERGSQPIWEIYGSTTAWRRCKKNLKSDLTTPGVTI